MLNMVLWVLPVSTVASFFVSSRSMLEHLHPDPDATPDRVAMENYQMCLSIKGDR